MQLPGSSRLWLIGALALAVAFVFWPSTMMLYGQWSDFVNITYTHGWLILAVCVALIWRARDEIAAVPAQPWPLAALALIAAIALWLVCYRASMEEAYIAVFPAIFWLAVATAFGWRVARLMIFPVAFFYFAIPTWSQLANPLQSLTVLAMRAFLSVTGPQAQIDGALIHIPNGSFVIEEGCSGLHFLIVGLAVAALHGELRRDPPRTRVEQLALMTGLSLLANWVRVYTVIEAGYLTDMRSYLVSVSHYWFGWGVFAVALVAFFWLSTWFSPAAAAEPPRAASHAAAPAARRELLGFALALLLLAGVPELSALLRNAHGGPVYAQNSAVVTAPRWTSVTPDAQSPWVPVFAGADEEARARFAGPAGETVEIYRARYLEQRQGAELVGDTSTLFGEHLAPIAQRDVRTAQGAFRETELAAADDGRSVVWSRYVIGRRVFLRGLSEQLWYGLNALFYRPPASVLALRVECAAECERARAVLREFTTSATLH
jgi:EpsI family protein